MFWLIVIVLVIYWICTRFGTGAGAVALVVAAVGLIALAASSDRDRRRAYWNWVDYWKGSSPKREQTRKERSPSQQWTVNVVNAPVAGQGRDEVERIKRDAYAAGIRDAKRLHGDRIGSESEMGRMFQTNNAVDRMELFICPKCGREVRTVSRKMWSEGRLMREYECPRCKVSIRTGI